MLKRLDYELTVPTAKTFLRRLLQVREVPVPAAARCYISFLLVFAVGQ